jgi:hypothetical protein
MPIRINLLAEAQAAEESRRRDPVKRVALAGVLLVLAVVLWASMLQLKIMSAKGDLNSLQTKWKSIEKGYQQAVECQRQAIEADQKLAALQQLTTNRFLWGTTLNAFQQTLNGVDNVQVVHLKTEQVFTQNEETKARTNDSRVTSGHQASATERVKLVIDAMDASSPPGARISKFKESITAVPWFRENLEKTNGVKLISRGAPQNSPSGRGQFVMFQLEAYFPEKTR